MKRRLLSAFLAVMMVLTMAPVAFAGNTETTTEYVAQVDGTNYATIAAAIEAANNKTLTLLKDVNGQIVIPKGKTVTLDLNGKTMTNTGTTLYNSGTLVVKDSSDDKSGKIVSTHNVGIGVNHNSTTTIEYANIEAQEGAVITGYATGATITIKDGVFTALDNAVVAGNGNKTDENTEGHPVRDNANNITIDGGTFIGNIQSSGYIACGIYAPWKDIITVNGGNFTVHNGIGIVARAGQVTVNGGTFTCTGSAKGGVGDKKFDMDAAQCVYFDASNPAYPAYNSATDYIKLQGGKFSSDVSAYVAEGYVQKENGTVEQLGETNAVAKVGNTYYKTLAEAVSAADNNTVTLLKNTVEDVVIPADKTITLDLNGKKIVNSTTAQDSKVADDARKHTITNNGTLTIMDSVGGGVVDNVSHGRAALYNNGTITEIKGGKFTRSVDNSTDSESANGNSWYVVYNAEGATISKISNGEFLALGHFSSLFSNCGTIDEISGGTFTQDHFIAFKNEGTVNKISGGVFSSTDESCIQNWGTIGEICGGTITAGSLGIWNFSSDEYKSNGTVEKISDGVISGTKAAIRLSNYDVEYLNKSADSLKNWASTTIVGGKINGALKVGNGTRVSISGGYFTVDPTAYCAEGKTGVASGDKKYPFTVGDIVNNVKVVPSGSTASTGDMDGKSDVVKNAMETARDAIGTRNTTIEGLAAVGSIEATEIDSDEVKYETEQLKKQGVSVEGKTVTFYIRPYMGITVMDATVENNVITSVTYNIVPQIQKIVSTATSVQDIRFNGNDKNAIRMNCQVPEVTTPITLSLPLPTGFATENLKVKHEKNGKLVGYHDTTYNTADNTITFTNDKGFSTFTVLSDARSTTIQFTDKDNHNIGSAKSYGPSNVNDALPTTAAESGYVFNGWKFEGIDGVYTTLTDELLTKLAAKSGTVSATPDFSKRSSGSSGGSSSGKTTYKVTTSAVNNGGVNASPSNAEKGATITITLSPDKGYKLDKLTVTDGSGKTVSTVKKSDTVYTFTMPASAVKVGVSYVKATETPSETKFNDVSANDWFASAVDYVTGKGMMNGTADNTFSPKANTTRGMVVTVLYRLENQPSTSAASFTDVASGAYYANAVAWANANGIVSGYGSGKFGPNDKVTREQLAAILYRYAQYKKYDVSVGEDTNILSYDDAQSISSYAIPAIQWACGAGVVTGKSGSKLDPKGNATRAEVAAMLMRFCENVK